MECIFKGKQKERHPTKGIPLFRPGSFHLGSQRKATRKGTPLFDMGCSGTSTEVDLTEENMLDRSQLQALVEYQKSAAPGMLAEGQAEMLIGQGGVGGGVGLGVVCFFSVEAQARKRNRTQKEGCKNIL